jgi:hypothetical protein
MQVTGAPSEAVTAETHRRASGVFWTLLFANLILLTLLCWGCFSFGSVQDALAFARGERLFVDATNKSFGTLKPGEKRVVAYRITNYCGSPVRILGCRPTCIARPAEQLPLTVVANGSVQISFLIRAPSTPTAGEFPLFVYTDDALQPELKLTLTGVVRAVAPISGER